jgi:hypothetical protein
VHIKRVGGFGLCVCASMCDLSVCWLLKRRVQPDMLQVKHFPSLSSPGGSRHRERVLSDGGHRDDEELGGDFWGEISEVQVTESLGSPDGDAPGEKREGNVLLTVKDDGEGSVPEEERESNKRT